MTLAVGTKVRCVVEPYDTKYEDFRLLGKTGVVVAQADVHIKSMETTVKWDDFNEGWTAGNWSEPGPYWTVDDTDLEVIA